MEAIRVIVVGAGGNRGAWFVGQLAGHRDYQITGLVDLISSAARAAAARHGLGTVPIFSSLDEALRAVACDAVLVATPDGYHVEPVCTALRHGAYVYVEKPLAITLEDCVAIVQADEAAGGRTMVGFNLRFAPLYRRLHQMIREGAVGRLLTIQADEFYYGGRTYFRRWNRLRKYSGGLWITKASHDFDLLCWLAGTLPRKVSASARLTHYVPKPEAGMYCHDCAIEADCPDSHFKIAHSGSVSSQQAAVRAEAGAPPPDLCLFNSRKIPLTMASPRSSLRTISWLLHSQRSGTVHRSKDPHRRQRGILEGSLTSPDLLYWRQHQDATLDQAQRIPLVVGEDEDGGHGGGDLFVLNDFAAFVRGEPSQAIGPAEHRWRWPSALPPPNPPDSGQSVAVRRVPGWQALRALAARQDQGRHCKR